MTSSEKSLIKNLYFKGKRIQEIVEITGISCSEARKYIKHHRLSFEREKYYLRLIKKAYSRGISIREIANENDMSETSLCSCKRKNEIKTKRFSVWNKRINEKMKKRMVKLYLKGNSCDYVAKVFGFKTDKTVEDVLKEKNIPTRDPRFNRQIDYTYFKKINSHDKAYILGLIYADGYICKDYCGVGIQLTESDGYLLKRIAKIIGKSATVNHIDCSCKRKKMPNTKDMFRLSVQSVVVANQLKKLGVVKNKTYCLSMPNKSVPRKYIYSFLRGFIDGDGVIYYNSNGGLACRWACKSEKFIDDILNLKLKDNFSKYALQHEMFAIEVCGGQKGIVSFLKKIYKNKGNLFLKRKYEKVQNKIGDIS